MKSHKKGIEFEQAKYDKSAMADLEKSSKELEQEPSFYGIEPQYLRPYIDYYAALDSALVNNVMVLELGSGTGRLITPFVERDCKITALDVSEKSLNVLQIRTGGKVKTLLASMDNIPLPDSSIDVVLSAGSLSYADSQLVDSEIDRILRPGGSLIILDTLNHNVIYRFNRFLQVLIGKRSYSTFKRIPNLNRIQSYSLKFQHVTVKYYGKYLWLFKPLAILLGVVRAVRVLEYLDISESQKKLAFKFLLVAHGFTPNTK